MAKLVLAACGLALCLEGFRYAKRCGARAESLEALQSGRNR